MPPVIEIQRTDDPRDVIHRAVQLLAEGKLVGFPTETVYVAAAHALKPEAVSQLAAAAPQKPPAAYVLALKGPAEAFDYLPRLAPVGNKLLRRAWPGPVTLSFNAPQVGGLFTALPAAVRDAVGPQGELSLRMPAHDAIQDVLRLMPAPLVLTGEMPRDGDPPTTAAALAESLPQLALVIDDGPTRYAQPSSVVRVDHMNRWEMTREGVISARTLGRLASEVYLFVCTGNTCRSPMAEGLFRKLLSDKLGCAEDSLVDRGYVVVSAGLSAPPGSPAAEEAIEALQQRNIDLSGHESQPLTERLLHYADHVYTMTRGHREAILSLLPELEERVQLLSRSGKDISDPIQFGLDEYIRCAGEIEGNLREILRGVEE